MKTNADIEMDQVQPKTGPPEYRNESTAWQESLHGFTTPPQFIHRNFPEMEKFLKQ